MLGVPRERSITDETADLLLQLRAGSAEAREVILKRVAARLEALTRKQLRAFPAVARWASADDVVQGATIRIWRAMDSVKPNDVREFFGLCAALIRRELLDMKRQLYGAEGVGAHHSSAPIHGGGVPGDLDTSYDPAKLARWTELHDQISALPTELREVFDLLWYQGLTHHEAAEVLGLSTKTVQRRWREARLQLHHLLDDCEI